MQIVVRQVSGLGNQLFQYAAGRYYARRYGASLRIAVEPRDKGFSYGNPRPFLLSHFQISSPTDVIGGYDRVILSKRPQLQPILGAARKFLRVQVFEEPVSQRYKFLEDLPIMDRTQTLYIVGYWQAHRIADDNADELRTSLSFKEPVGGKNLEIFKRIQTCRTPVSLHVRRGDYTLAAEGNIALPMTYYHQAIAEVRRHLDEPTFFVFSDDMAYTRQNLPGDIEAVFVDHNDDFSSHEDLRLMSSCRHHIIANSTFSWWGAWLNPREDKMVYAPKQWHLKPDSYYPDLCPRNWILADL